MYMITPRDHMSHDLSYFSGPSTSGAEETEILNLNSSLKDTQRQTQAQAGTQVNTEKMNMSGFE